MTRARCSFAVSGIYGSHAKILLGGLVVLVLLTTGVHAGLGLLEGPGLDAGVGLVDVDDGGESHATEHADVEEGPVVVSFPRHKQSINVIVRITVDHLQGQARVVDSSLQP